MSRTEHTLEGGCLCGAVRYRVEPTASGQRLLPLPYCQLASGAPVVAWFSVPFARFPLHRAARRAPIASSAGSDARILRYVRSTDSLSRQTMDAMPTSTMRHSTIRPPCRPAITSGAGAGSRGSRRRTPFPATTSAGPTFSEDLGRRSPPCPDKTTPSSGNFGSASTTSMPRSSIFWPSASRSRRRWDSTRRRSGSRLPIPSARKSRSHVCASSREEAQLEPAFAEKFLNFILKEVIRNHERMREASR